MSEMLTLVALWTKPSKAFPTWTTPPPICSSASTRSEWYCYSPIPHVLNYCSLFAAKIMVQKQLCWRRRWRSDKDSLPEELLFSNCVVVVYLVFLKVEVLIWLIRNNNGEENWLGKRKRMIILLLKTVHKCNGREMTSYGISVQYWQARKAM